MGVCGTTPETDGITQASSTTASTSSATLTRLRSVRFSVDSIKESERADDFVDRRRANQATRPAVLRDPDRNEIELVVVKYLVECASKAPWRQRQPEDLASVVAGHLSERLTRAESIRDLHVQIAFQESGVAVPALQPLQLSVGGVMQHTLDQAKARALSELVMARSLSLEKLVKLVRGETTADPRPNKAMDPARYKRLLKGYTHCDRMVKAAWYGLTTEWVEQPDGIGSRIKNHESANRFANAVTRSLREGQDGGQYIVLDISILDRWKEVVTSPLSAVEKKGEDPRDVCRVIHDLACPRGNSTNANTVRTDLPAVTYKPVAILARRIEDLARRFPELEVMMMSGDVKGAYRHLMTAASDVYRMGAQWPRDQSLIIDVSAPFGWTASPAYYGMYGGAITWLVAKESPSTMSGGDSDDNPFFGYEWVDDHVMIEVNTGNRLHWANQALRLAMLAVLGPRAVNEKKFTSWSTKLKVLGLEFDTVQRTVSMPAEKVIKALGRVAEMRSRGHTTRSALRKLLGSLRHVCTCLPSARAFFQGLQQATIAAHPVGRVKLSQAAIKDLHWFEWILTHGQLRGLPTSMFAKASEPNVHLYMDASNDGLVVLDPAHRTHIQLRFDDTERLAIARCIHGHQHSAGFTINVREHLCMGLAAVLWGHLWANEGTARITHVHCWSDNASAVSWVNAKASRNPLSQEINRAIGLQEAVHGFRMHAQHLPGEINTMADAGSRAWQHPHTDTWTNLSLHWQQTPLQSSALADSSKRKYDGTWRQWCEWCDSLQFPTLLTASAPDHSLQLALFAVHCWRAGNTIGTVLSKASHVSWHHQVRVGYAVGLHAGHKLAMQGMHRLSPPPRSKRPATKPLLRLMRHRLDFSTARDRVLWGAAVVGFFFLLRKSEYLGSSPTKTMWFALRYADVKCTDRWGLEARSVGEATHATVCLRGSKTDQHGKTTQLKHAATKEWLCPVQAAWALMQHGKKLGLPKTAPLCSVTADSVLTAANMTTAIKQAASAIGHDPRDYGTHSMRSGGATAMFGGGVDVLTIKKFGRWRSDCVETYAVLHDACVAALAPTMVAAEPAL